VEAEGVIIASSGVRASGSFTNIAPRGQVLENGSRNRHGVIEATAALAVLRIGCSSVNPDDINR